MLAPNWILDFAVETYIWKGVMDHHCDACEATRQKLISYLHAEVTILPELVIEIQADAHTRARCPLCTFLLELCGITVNSDGVISIAFRADRHGNLYCNRKGGPDSRRYLLPLQPSRNCLQARLYSNNCDFDLLQRWLKCCQEWHGPECYTPGWASVIRNVALTSVRFIDVHENCIVEMQPPVEYVALSYVWGSSNVLQTTRQNLSKLSLPGALDIVQLPRTIADAMAVTYAIGLRYLWTDSLCIVQDDSQDKHKQIMLMDQIYGNAILTINAASGKHANAGLPGVKAATRNIEQSVIQLSDDWSLLATQPVLSEAADNSTWNTRGWTYQERFLSKRSITFMENSIYFQCQRMIWCEDIVAEREGVVDYYQMEDYLPVSWQPELNTHMYRLHYALHAQRSTNWTEYLRTVEEYSPRSLSHPEDGLNAFAGMSTVLARMFRSDMLCGLPESLFDCALLWQPAEVLKRRVSKTGQALFPSWSWAAWDGAIVYEDISPHLKMLSPELVRRTKPLHTWHRVSADGETSLVKTTGKMGSFHLAPFSESLPPGWHMSSGSLFDIFSGTYFYHEHNPEQFFAVPAEQSAQEFQSLTSWVQLQCTAQVADVTIRRDSTTTSHDDEPPHHSILNDTGQWIGSARFDTDVNLDEAQIHPMMILSEGTIPMNEIERFWQEDQKTNIAEEGAEWYYFYNVMILGESMGTFERRGLGKISKLKWATIESVEKEIVLT